MLDGSDFGRLLLGRLQKRRAELLAGTARGLKRKEYWKHVGKLAEGEWLTSAIEQLLKTGVSADDEDSK